MDACHIMLLHQLRGTDLLCHHFTLVALLLVQRHIWHQQVFYKAALLSLLSMHLHLGLVVSLLFDVVECIDMVVSN